jgi:hypothetical protein
VRPWLANPKIALRGSEWKTRTFCGRSSWQRAGLSWCLCVLPASQAAPFPHSRIHASPRKLQGLCGYHAVENRHGDHPKSLSHPLKMQLISKWDLAHAQMQSLPSPLALLMQSMCSFVLRACKLCHCTHGFFSQELSFPHNARSSPTLSQSRAPSPKKATWIILKLQCPQLQSPLQP